MRTRLLAAAALASLAVVSPAAASEAPGDTTIGYVEDADSELKILVNVPADATVDVDDVTVTVDGVEAEASAAPADSTTSVRRTAVLVMDTSNSMRGDRFAAAQAAAHTFLDTVPDDVYVGIISFDSDVTEELAPGLDRDEAADVVDGLELSEQTRLYDGVQAGLAMAGTEGQRQLLVLSDGADTGGDATLDDTTAAVEDAEALVNVVGLEQSGKAVDALESLSDAGGGSLINADSKALEKAFSAQADVLARQVLVSATVPSEVTAAEGTVTVALGSDAGTLTADAFTPLGRAPQTGPEAPQVLPADPGPALSPTWLFGGLAAFSVGVLMLLVALGPRKTRPMQADEIAMTYTRQVTGSHRADSGPSGGQSGQVTDTAERVLKANKSLESRIAERLEGAGNPFQPAEWVVVHLTVFLSAGVLGLLLGGGSLILGLLFLALGAFGPWFFLGFKRKRRRKAFERLLPDTLQLMSGSLAAGLSLAQSIDTIVREGQEPVAGEFRRVLVETRLGISLDDALEGVAQRFDSKDFAWVVMAIRIQRQVGGNLAELLDTVAGTMRDREYMRRQVAALAAEGKLSAWVLGGLPPGFLGYLMLAKRDYVMVMFTDPRGWLMLGGAALFLGLGVFWMSRLVKVEV